MRTVTIPNNYQHASPAGAEVRVLMCNEYGGIAHCTLRQGKISKAVTHKTVSEFWHVLSGKGLQVQAKFDEDKVRKKPLPH